MTFTNNSDMLATNLSLKKYSRSIMDGDSVVTVEYDFFYKFHEKAKHVIFMKHGYHRKEECL